VKLGRNKQPVNAPVSLPPSGESVTVSLADGARVPARVLEVTQDSVLVAVTVPMRPLAAAQLRQLMLEYNSPRGRVRLQGEFAQDSAADPDLLRLREPRSVEVLQERSYVRIQSARPVLVYSGSDNSRIESYTIDVSGGGFLLAGSASLVVGEEVNFRLSVASGSTPISGTGRVARVDAMGRRAVAFESISDLDRRRLVRFIFECQRAERRRGLVEDGDGSR
jgi:hypothetical protein